MLLFMNIISIVPIDHSDIDLLDFGCSCLVFDKTGSKTEIHTMMHPFPEWPQHLTHLCSPYGYLGSLPNQKALEIRKKAASDLRICLDIQKIILNIYM